MAENRTKRVEYQPYGAARALFTDRSPQLLIEGPAGTGKSRACMEKINLIAQKYPGVRIAVVRKMRADLTQSFIPEWEERVLIPEDNVDKLGGSNAQQYTYPNGSVVVLLGLDRDTKVMSTQFDVAYVQEATQLDEEEVSRLVTRLRNGKMPYQQLLADCNPEGPMHWLNLRAATDQMTRLVSTHKDNPTLWNPTTDSPTPRGEAYLQELAHLPGVLRDRLYFGKWVAAEGMIYMESFDRQRNVVPAPAAWPKDRFGPIPPDDWARYWTVDFGFTNPFVLQMWAEDPDGRLYMYREIYHSQRLVEEHARRALEIMDKRPKAIIVDHDAEDRATLSLHLKMPTVRARKEVNIGIQATALRFKAAGDGRPRLYFIDGARIVTDQLLLDAHKPTQTTEEIEGYVWSDRARKEEPEKTNDHGMDATRYMVMFRDWMRSKSGTVQISAESGSPPASTPYKSPWARARAARVQAPLERSPRRMVRMR